MLGDKPLEYNQEEKPRVEVESLKVGEKLDYLKEILKAPVYNVCIETPLQLAEKLSLQYAPNNVYLKREDLQPKVFSFKLRGAYNKMRSLSEEEKARGVVACSAGNHAQGVALAARQLQVKATIVMPEGTPKIKWSNVEKLGAKVILYGSDFDTAKQRCEELASLGPINIPPYDDPLVIAGQGTIGLEVLKQMGNWNQPISFLFVAIGGGGLISGILAYVKALHPKVKVIGVETFDANAMAYAMLHNRAEKVPYPVGLFADGAAVGKVGEETCRICLELLDGIILVSTDNICAAIKDIFEETRSVVEPAGALALAGLKKYLRQFPNPFDLNRVQKEAPVVGTSNSNNPNLPFRHYVQSSLILSNRFFGDLDSIKVENPNSIAVVSGANLDFDRLRFIADRANLGSNREVLISVTVPDTPGSFVKLYEIVYPRSVTSFSYRYNGTPNGNILLSFLLLDPNNRQTEIDALQTRLTLALFSHFIDLSNDELAKTHAKYMVGGRSDVQDEKVYRFEFPERPGALGQFLSKLKFNWNVSLFHYRNYGGDTGKVLVGIQISDNEMVSWNLALESLNYPYVQENLNQIYKLYLNQ